MKHLSRGDVLFVLLLVFLSIFFGGLLYSDMKSGSGSGSGEVIGTITFKNRVAQRKFQGTVVWETIEQDSPLRNRDSIRTSHLSEAVITLKDGTKIDLDENSMVLLNLAGDRAELDFAYGRVSAGEGSSSLRIRSGDKVIDSKNSKISLEKSEPGSVKNSPSGGGDLNITVEKGDAVVQKDGERLALRENEKLEYKGDNAKVIEKNIQLLSPPHLSRFSTTKRKKNVELKWNSKTPSTIILSHYSSLVNPLLRKSVPSGKINIDLEEGNYYWKVVSGEKESPVYRFKIYSNLPPKPLSPGSNIQLSTLNESLKQTFSWKPYNSGTESYLVEIYRKNTGTWEKLDSAQTRVNSVRLDLSPGVYKWKVGSKSPIDSTVSWSEEEMFSVSKIQNLESPVGLQPGSKSKILLPIANKKGILFSWKKIPQAKSYTLEVLDSSDGKTIVSEKYKTNFALIQTSWKEGNYKWRLQAVGEGGSVSKYGSFQYFNIKETEPIQISYPKDDATVYYIPGKTINLNWKKIPTFGEYRITIKTKSKTNSYKTQKSYYSYKPIGEESVQWKVDFLDKEGLSLAESKWHKFSVELGIQAPTLRSPQKSQVIDLTYDNSIRFEWNSTPYIKYFRLEIYSETGGRPIYKEQTTERYYTLKRLNRLYPGKFKWRVVSISNEGKEKPSPYYDFQVFINTEKGKIEFISPDTFYVE